MPTRFILSYFGHYVACADSQTATLSQRQNPKAELQRQKKQSKFTEKGNRKKISSSFRKTIDKDEHEKTRDTGARCLGPTVYVCGSQQRENLKERED